MKKQLRSFGCAFRGIGAALCREAHLRFHFVAAFYVLLFSLFYGFTPAQYAVLIILIALVIAAELVNTAIEEVCDLITQERNSHIRYAKDIAAGAVLAVSIGAAAVGVVFFWNPPVIAGIAEYFVKNIPQLVLLIISAVLSFLFVLLGIPGLTRKKK